MWELVKTSLLLFVLLFFNAACVNAQVINTSIKLPDNVDPGIIEKTIQKPVFNKAEPKKEKKEEFNFKAPKKPEKPALFEKQVFKLNGVEFWGNTVFKDEILEKFTEDLVGKEIDSDQVNSLTNKITKLYKNKGYITSFAYIPNQKVESGILKVNIFEGLVGNIDIKGTKWTRDSYIKKGIFRGNRIKENNVFNINSLQLSVKELNRTDYLRGNVRIQKSEKPRSTDIILNIQEKLPFDFGVGWDNLGREYIGKQRANIVLSNKNLTGFGDSIYSGVSLASGTVGVSSGYYMPVGPYGTKFGLNYSYSDIAMGGIYESLEIEGNSHLFTPSIIQPVYKSDRLRIDSDLSLDFRSSRTTIANIADLQNYKIRVLNLGINGVKEDRKGRWLSRIEFSQGLPGLGSTPDSESLSGSGKFFKMQGRLIRVQALPKNMFGIFRVSGQFSPDLLYAPEKMEIGGTNTVRGFDEGMFLGETGYIASVELRTPVPFMPKVFKIPYWVDKSLDLKLKDKVHFAAFYDQGLVRLDERAVGTERTRFLQGLGVGLRCYLTKFLTATVDFGIPLGRKQTSDQNAVRVHFGLTSDVI